MKYILFILLMIIDFILFIFLFIYEKYFIQILIIHTIIYIISWRLYLKFNTNIEGLPFFINYFMPILGPIIFFIFYFSVNYFYGDSEVVEDYEQLLNSSFEEENRERVNYEREIKTMSFIDLFSFIDPEKKKEILIDSQYSYKINNAKILKKGLEAEDKEVQHYSATLLNSQENELTNNISFLRSSYNDTKDEKILDQLIDSYQMYINSTLIGADSISIFKEEYIEVLLKKINLNNYDLDLLIQLFKAYVSNDDLYHATLINHKIEVEFPNSIQIKINNFNILYKKGYISQLIHELSILNKEEIQENPRLKELHNFFLEEN